MNTSNHTPENDKRKIERSAAYPNAPIEQSIEFVRQIRKPFLKAVFTRESLSAILGKSEVKREVSTASQYGLLEKLAGEGYRITQLAEHILDPISPEEKADNCVECFKKPKLYNELIEKYKGHTLPSDEQLRVILTRQHGITSAAAPQVVEVFIENAIYVGLLNQQRVLMPTTSTELAVRNKVESANSDSDKTPETNTPNSSTYTPSQIERPVNQGLASNSNDAHNQHQLPEDLVGKIKITIPLSGKKVALLTYPETINAKDIKILAMQIDQLALTIDEE
jgi:hypothetical protein